MQPGGPLEGIGNGAPRWMIVTGKRVTAVGTKPGV